MHTLREILEPVRYEVAQAIRRYRGYLVACEQRDIEVQWTGPYLESVRHHDDRIRDGWMLTMLNDDTFPFQTNVDTYEDRGEYGAFYWFNESDLVEWLGGEDYMTMHNESRMIVRLTEDCGWDEDYEVWDMAYNHEERVFVDPDDIEAL